MYISYFEVKPAARIDPVDSGRVYFEVQGLGVAEGLLGFGLTSNCQHNFCRLP